MTVPCFLLAGCFFLPGHAQNAHSPHRPADHAIHGKSTRQEGAKSRRAKRRGAAASVPLPQPRPESLSKNESTPVENETEPLTPPEEESAATPKSEGKTAAPEKPAEEKAEERPAAIPEPRPEPENPDKAKQAEGPTETEKPEEPAKKPSSEKAQADADEKGADAKKDEGAGEESSEEDAAEKTPSKDEFRDIPEMKPTPDPECAALEASGMAEFEKLPPLSEGVCGTPNPIRTTALKLADGTKVTLEPAPVSRCAVITALATWTREDLEPAAREQLGGPVTALRVAGSYVCRGRDGNPAAKMSEHGHANAIDISAFKTKSGQWKDVRSMGAGGNGFLAIVRGKACGRFTTVIGPGLDRYHADHLHLDTKLRGRNGRALFCQ